MSLTYKIVEIPKLGDIARLEPGTQIAYKGSYANLHPSLKYFYRLFSSEEYYYHHGVYLGDNRVAHFSGENKSDAKPRECNILDFIDGANVDGKIYRVVFDEDVEMLPVEERLRRAEEVLKEPSRWPGYQICKNNCETFATWVTTGREWSEQVRVALINVVFNVGVPALASSSVGSIQNIS